MSLPAPPSSWSLPFPDVNSLSDWLLRKSAERMSLPSPVIAFSVVKKTSSHSFEIESASMDVGAFQKACAEQGLRFSRYLGNSPRLRAVTHNDLTRADVDAALEIARAVLSKTRAPALSV